MLDHIYALAQNPKIAISVSAATSVAGASTSYFDLAKDWLPLASVAIGIVVSLVVIVVQICEMMRKNRESRDLKIKTDLEIAILRQKAKVLEEIDRLSNE